MCYQFYFISDFHLQHVQILQLTTTVLRLQYYLFVLQNHTAYPIIEPTLTFQQMVSIFNTYFAIYYIVYCAISVSMWTIVSFYARARSVYTIDF